MQKPLISYELSLKLVDLSSVKPERQCTLQFFKSKTFFIVLNPKIESNEQEEVVHVNVNIMFGALCPYVISTFICVREIQLEVFQLYIITDFIKND